MNSDDNTELSSETDTAVEPRETTSVRTDTQSTTERTGIRSKYYRARSVITDEIPLGQLLWDLSRITAGVIIVGGVLFFLTGLSTPFVAVSSGSMEPNINTGDMLVITEYNPENTPPLAKQPHIITANESSHSSDPSTAFNGHGDVIVFQQPHTDIPILHRAHYHVEQGENWVDRVDPDGLPPGATCDAISECPAKQSGYITAGDNNSWYDQVNSRPVVTESQIIGVGQYRIPYLGNIRIVIDLLL